VQAPDKTEFRATLVGVTLSAEQREQVCRAMQQALLQAMAGLDFEGDRVAVALPRDDGGNGGTQGVWGGPVSRAELEGLLPGGGQ
jgi:hypothetical protein